MKSLIFLFFVIHYVLSTNLETDLRVDQILQLEKLVELSKKMEMAGNFFAPSVRSIGIRQEDVTIVVHTQAVPNGTVIKLTDVNRITEVSQFNPELKTVFYVHGWWDTVDAKSCHLVRDALLAAANVNVLLVNWDECSVNLNYIISQSCVPGVGKYIGQFVENLTQAYNYSLDDITVVGHSLGAHIAGHVGKYTNGSLRTIVGLDPAGPLYFKSITDARLTQDDAQFVQVIHTDAILLGVTFNLGDVDFWPNGGFAQKGCGLDQKCSHGNSYRYYAESLSSNEFFARQCDSYEHFQEGKCNQNPKSLMGGLNVNTSAVGKYYLDTNSKSPFGMGDI